MLLDEILWQLKNSTNIAYTISNQRYSYSEFYKFICNIYNFLLINNKRRKPVIVYGSKEVWMKAAFLACSFAGITYVPIDKSIPNERVDNIISQVKPYCIIGNFISEKCKTIFVEEISEIMKKENYEEIGQIYLSSKDIYYIIFTSGTTGEPKGVKVTYNNLDSCIRWLRNIVDIDNEVILNQANFSFDLSVADLYLSVVTGSEHFIMENTIKFDFAHIFNQLKNSNVTIAVLTPTFVDLLLLDRSFNEKLLPNLKTVIFCGEKLLRTTVNKLYSRFSNIKIINSYGPTECTFAVTSIEITNEIANKENIPVGRVKSGVDIVILDANKKELPNGQAGEILILGESVAAGYVVPSEKDSFIKYRRRCGYLTGDIGYLEDGVLYYEGRQDNQVKYNGYRIELSDIEKNIYKLNYFEKVKVIDKKSDDGKTVKLIAFVKLKENINKSDTEINSELKEKIPEYMCPLIKIVNEFPINNNGKTDVVELMEMANGRENC